MYVGIDENSVVGFLMRHDVHARLGRQRVDGIRTERLLAINRKYAHIGLAVPRGFSCEMQESPRSSCRKRWLDGKLVFIGTYSVTAAPVGASVHKQATARRRWAF